jgi:hypothetical protein
LLHFHLGLSAKFSGETVMHPSSIVQAASLTLASGITIPNSKMAREVTELVRDTENSLLFNHSSRVHYFSAATGKRKGLTFDPELLYVSAMFHDLGLTPKHSSATDRFEVDGANAARDFLRQHQIYQQDIDTVWTSIALHTTPDIPQYMHPVVAPLTNGVEMDVLGIAYSEFSDPDREATTRIVNRLERLTYGGGIVDQGDAASRLRRSFALPTAASLRRLPSKNTTESGVRTTTIWRVKATKGSEDSLRIGVIPRCTA